MMIMTIHLIFVLSKELIQFDYNERRRLVVFPTLLKQFYCLDIDYFGFYLDTNNSSGTTTTLVSSSALNVIVYSSISIGALIFLLLTILFFLICWRRRQRITTKKGNFIII
jgi:hypothetical protein